MDLANRKPEAEDREAELRAAGRKARRQIPRGSQAEFKPPARDPVEFIQAQNEVRIPELVPLRTERMSADPFSFYRGNAGLMSADLAAQPRSGRELLICGDAHIANFGLYASPERRLVFDLNDFDEATIGPWEWDVKRLVASVVIGGGQLGISRQRLRRLAMLAARSYHVGLYRALQISPLERYYFHIGEHHADQLLQPKDRVWFGIQAHKARRRTSASAVRKFMEPLDGQLRFREDPPAMVHISEAEVGQVHVHFETYRQTVRSDVAVLLSMYAPVDFARRAVGVGSVGTACYVVAFRGRNKSRLVLQVKQALPSAVGGYSPVWELNKGVIRVPQHEGERVVVGQQILQAVSDPFLGHFQANGRDFYVRQFRDMKWSFETAGMTARRFGNYVNACGFMLARAHSQSPSAPWVLGYLGKSTAFDEAVVDWAFAYAEQSLQDYGRFRRAVGRN